MQCSSSNEGLGVAAVRGWVMEPRSAEQCSSSNEGLGVAAVRGWVMEPCSAAAATRSWVLRQWRAFCVAAVRWAACCGSARLCVAATERGLRASVWGGRMLSLQSGKL